MKKKIKGQEAVPKNIYEKFCKNPACAVLFECDHGNREFCNKRCKRNYERDQKKAVMEEIKRKKNLMNRAIGVFEEFLQAGKTKISKDELKSRNIDATCFTVRVKSLKGEIIYVYENYCLHKTSEDEFLITKTI